MFEFLHRQKTDKEIKYLISVIIAGLIVIIILFGVNVVKTDLQSQLKAKPKIQTETQN